jgi:hypothetical protein
MLLLYLLVYYNSLQYYVCLYINYSIKRMQAYY